MTIGRFFFADLFGSRPAAFGFLGFSREAQGAQLGGLGIAELRFGFHLFKNHRAAIFVFGRNIEAACGAGVAVRRGGVVVLRGVGHAGLSVGEKQTGGEVSPAARCKNSIESD